MPRVCTICGHKKRAEIDEAIVQGEAIRRIAAQYRLSPSALQRHKDGHIPPVLAKAHEAAEVARADGLLGMLQDLETDARRIGEKAEKKKDLRTALAAIRELVRIVELTAKLRGELAQEGQTTINMLVADPGWLEIRTRIVEALEPYPEARLAVVSAMELENQEDS